MAGAVVSPDLHEEPKAQPGKTIRPGVWRDEVKSRATRLRSQARWLELSGPILSAAKGDPMQVEVYDPLDRVFELAHNDRVNVREWLSGSQIEECWRLLRQAEEGLVRAAAPTAVVDTVKPAAEAHADSNLGRDHALVRALEQAAATSNDPEKVRRAALQVISASHETSDGLHRQVRSFRNVLLAVSVVMLGFAAVALTGQAVLDPTLLPAPEGVELGGTATLALVMFFGCVGALFTAIPSLAQIPEKASPFNLPRQQAILKVITGAWAAVIGLMVIQAGLAGGTTSATTIGGLAILALLFGAGQEAVTRFADKKAGDILGAA